ncbi:MAG: DNA-binding protein [Rubritepida sp.]|nr:DNA-binding protein [Rubritepida sp.]
MLSETKYSLRGQQAIFTHQKKTLGSVEQHLNTRSATSADVAVGQKIKRLRRAAGHTQKHVADLVGVTGAQFHRYETGATRVAASRLMDIATALGVRAEVLIGEVSAPTAPPAPLSVAGEATNDLVELVQLFSAMADPRKRSTLISFARTIAENGPADRTVTRDAP